MLVPVKLKILGWIKVSYLDEVIDDDGSTPLAGRTVPGDKKIEVSKEEHKDGETLHSTLLHETIHHILSVSGHSEWLGSEREEAIVTALENHLAPLVCFKTGASVRWKEIRMLWED